MTARIVRLISAGSVCVALTAILTASACRFSSASGPPEIDHVNISIASAGGRVRVGDTVSVSADPYTAYGFLIGWRGDVTWSISDSEVARLEPTQTANQRVAHGLRVGTATIRATIAGKAGERVLEVVP